MSSSSSLSSSGTRVAQPLRTSSRSHVPPARSGTGALHGDDDQLAQAGGDEHVTGTHDLGLPRQRYGDDVAEQAQAGLPGLGLVAQVPVELQRLVGHARPGRRGCRDGHRAVEPDDQSVGSQAECHQAAPAQPAVAREEAADQQRRQRQSERVRRPACEASRQLRAERSDQQPSLVQDQVREAGQPSARSPAEAQRDQQDCRDQAHRSSLAAAPGRVAR